MFDAVRFQIVPQLLYKCKSCWGYPVCSVTFLRCKVIPEFITWLMSHEKEANPAFIHAFLNNNDEMDKAKPLRLCIQKLVGFL